MAIRGQHDQGWRDFVLGSLPTPRMEANAEPVSLEPASLAATVAPMSFSAAAELAPHFDPIEIMPPAAQERLRKLRQRSADAHALIPPFEDVREASMARVEAENALKQLTAHPQDFGHNLKPDDRRVVVAEKHLAKVADDFERVKQRAELRTAAWQQASAALANVETWLRHGRPNGTVLEAVEVEEPMLQKNEGLLDAIERLRRRGRELRADLHRIESAPYPSSYCKAQMRAQIEALAMRGEPDVTNLIEHGGKIEFQTMRVQSQVTGADRQLAFAEIEAATPFQAWLHTDALIKRLDAKIDSEADDAAALSPEARPLAEAEILSDILANDRGEAELTWKAMAQNLPVEFRSDLSPLAVLRLELITAARPGPSETTPGYSWPRMR
jgi:hypothetical protein